MTHYVYIISRTKELLGVISVRHLLTALPGVLMKDIMNVDVINVAVNLDQEVVADILSKYDLFAVLVVNKKNQLMKIIMVDDILEIIDFIGRKPGELAPWSVKEDEATEDIYKMVAATDIYDVKGGMLSIVKKRIPWLLIFYQIQ